MTDKCPSCGYEPEPELSVFDIKCSFAVYVTLKVPAASFKDALEKICGREIFTTYDPHVDPADDSGQVFGFEEAVLADGNIRVEVDSVDGDPSPTGGWPKRNWIYSSEE